MRNLDSLLRFNGKVLAMMFWVVGSFFVFSLQAQQPPEKPQAVINIGAIYALTGPASYWGTYGLNGLRLAIDEENANGGVSGKRINLVIQDSQTNPANAVSAYHWLISAVGIKAVAGDVWNFLISSLIPVAGNSGTLHLAPLAARTDNPPSTFFSLGANSESIAKAMDTFFKVHPEIKKAAIFGWDEAWGHGYLKEWEKACRTNNVEIVFRFLNPMNWAYDYRSDVAKVVRLKPDLVIFAHQGEIIVKMFAEFRYRPIFLTTSNFSEVWHRKLLSETLLEGVYYTEWPPSEEFVQKYEKRYGTYPLFSASENYDIGKIIVEGLRHNPENPAAYIKALKMNGSTGKIDFTGSYWGNQSEASLMQVRNNKIVKVE